MRMTGAEKQASHRVRSRAYVLTLESENSALRSEREILLRENARLLRYIEYVKGYIARNIPHALDPTPSQSQQSQPQQNDDETRVT
jgi:hypothetical protein